MQALEWLDRSVPGFRDLSSEERDAIRDFALLWSLFEGTILATEGNAASIVQMSGKLCQPGTLSIQEFSPALIHFRQRYYDGREFTREFHGLNLRQRDRIELVKAVLSGEQLTDADTLGGLFIIILRLRNNLFHGLKWAYAIKDQLNNFRYANESLIAIMQLHGM